MWSDGEQMRRGQPAWGGSLGPPLSAPWQPPRHDTKDSQVHLQAAPGAEGRSGPPKEQAPPLHLAAQEWACEALILKLHFVPEAIFSLTFSPGSELNSGRSQKPPTFEGELVPRPLHLVWPCTQAGPSPRVCLTSWSWMGLHDFMELDVCALGGKRNKCTPEILSGGEEA